VEAGAPLPWPPRPGARLRAGLERLDGVVEVRGQGLLLGAELEEGVSAPDAAAAALAKGLLVNPVTPTTLRFLPSLLVTDDEIDQALEILAGVLGRVPA
jgi:acetylornithine/N-succinyldiaminopimelate aminotransferase